jgi:hypothetical protein
LDGHVQFVILKKVNGVRSLFPDLNKWSREKAQGGERLGRVGFKGCKKGDSERLFEYAEKLRREKKVTHIVWNRVV